MIAIFDLDETLIHGDCVTLWCQWLCEQELIQDIDGFLQEEQLLMEAYRAKILDQQDCMNLVLRPIIHLPIEDVHSLITQFVHEKIAPIVYLAGQRLIQEHYEHGDDVIIISASPQMIVSSIAHICFNVNQCFGINVVQKDHHYTTKIQGVIPYQSGKVNVFEIYLTQHDINPNDAYRQSYFYSDSSNDLPLLEKVAYPNIINPDDELRTIAEANNWPILHFTTTLQEK
ncbi:HAD family hydrolase [Wohlfahrtiimonas larvae]|uniref:HAD family hydrolase n=1 Tax=Wohlfahrtiimonas larvae TaxID=1157986 RepID=A0ABP9MWU9_9GAMM|nr:HAD-IB family hydrolase [Wohlfahrtiimonas larvae]